MNHLYMITQLLAVFSVLSFSWLTLRAFGKHAGWGVGVLLLSPVSAALFGMKYWDSVKKPFLLYLVSTCTTVGLAFYLFSAWGGWELLRANTRIQQGMETQRLSRFDAELDWLSIHLKHNYQTNPVIKKKSRMETYNVY